MYLGEGGHMQEVIISVKILISNFSISSICQYDIVCIYMEMYLECHWDLTSLVIKMGLDHLLCNG